jgi:hypothetical protein
MLDTTVTLTTETQPITQHFLCLSPHGGGLWPSGAYLITRTPFEAVNHGDFAWLITGVPLPPDVAQRSSIPILSLSFNLSRSAFFLNGTVRDAVCGLALRPMKKKINFILTRDGCVLWRNGKNKESSMKTRKLLKTLSVVILSIILFQTASCGFILYPERRGRGPKVGQIDPGVAIIDAILLLPGLVPGIIAFAVDFSSGAIYLPGSAEKGRVQDRDILSITPEGIDVAELERVLSEHTGKPVHIDRDRIKLLRTNDPEYLRKHFVKAGFSIDPATLIR